MSERNGTNREYPHDLTVEKACLGAMLLDNDCIEDILIRVTRGDFYLPAHQEMFDAITSIFEANGAVDLLMLRNELLNRGKLESSGGVVAIAELEQHVLSTGAAAEYAHIVWELSGRRRLIQQFQTAAKQAMEGTASVENLVEMTQQSIVEICESGRTKASQWVFDDLERMLEPQEPLEYLIRGVIPKGSLGMIYGAPASLKTMVGIEMLLNVSAGIKFLERKPSDGGFSTVRMPGLLLNCDSPYQAVRGRIAAGAFSRGIQTDSQIYAWHPWGFDATNRRHMDFLRRRIELNGIGLVLVDCLGNMRGEIEENSAEMVRVVAGFRPLVEELKCTVMLIHHSRKDGETFRGSSAITSPLDWSYHAKREKGSDDVLLVADKQRLAPMPDLNCRFAYDPVPGHPEELREFRFFQCDPPSKAAAEEQQQTIIDLIRDQPGMSKREAVAAAMCEGIAKGKAESTIDYLLKEKRITAKAGERGRLSLYANL